MNRVYVLSGPIGLGRLDEHSREHLKHAKLVPGSDLESPVARLAERLDLDTGLVNRATTRYLGEQGRLADGWVAAADPVYLEPRLDHLCLMAQDVDASEREALVEHLNRGLADDGLSFVIEGEGVYLRANPPIATSAYPTRLIDGLLPNKYLPDGDSANEYRTLLAEIEMSLHEHPVNEARQARGLKPVNSLWLWGGCRDSGRDPLALPNLYSDDPLLRGMWRMHGADEKTFSSPEECLADDTDCVVDIGDELDRIPSLLRGGRPITVFSRDGYTLDDPGTGRWRFWVRRHAALEPPA